MSKIDDFASLYTEEDPNVVALARIVRTMEGAQRFKVAIGSIIQNHPGTLRSGASYGYSVAPAQGDIEAKVAQLKKSLAKLDSDSIRGILKQMESSKDLPRNKRFDMVKTMLEEFLKDKLNQSNKTAMYATRNAARGAKDKATGQG